MGASARGMTLVELAIVVAIIGVVAASSVPRFGVAMERTRVDEATATLRSIWHAQRMHWLEHKAYAPTLRQLVEQQLLPASLLEREPPFVYRLSGARATRFDAVARRMGSRDWRGVLRVDELGRVSGDVRNREGRLVQPSGI